MLTKHHMNGDGMKDYYDSHGNYKGKVDDNGNVYDEHSNYLGRYDENDNFYDKHSNYRGRRIKKD